MCCVVVLFALMTAVRVNGSREGDRPWTTTRVELCLFGVILYRLYIHDMGTVTHAFIQYIDFIRQQKMFQ